MKLWLKRTLNHATILCNCSLGEMDDIKYSFIADTTYSHTALQYHARPNADHETVKLSMGEFHTSWQISLMLISQFGNIFHSC